MWWQMLIVYLVVGFLTLLIADVFGARDDNDDMQPVIDTIFFFLWPLTLAALVGYWVLSLAKLCVSGIAGWIRTIDRENGNE